MKAYFFSILCILSISLFANKYEPHEPLLIVVLMVKNEEKVICETLEPFIQAGVDSFFVFDTGSTDKTIEVTEKFFQTHNIQHWIIRQEPFIDFATSRNRALELARQEFKNGCFMIMPDAEWYLQNVNGLLQFCEQHKNENHPAYLVRIIGDNLDFYTARLIRMSSEVHFSGAVHEVLNYPANKKVSHNVFFKRGASSYGMEKSKERWKRDYDLLLTEHKRNPNDSRTVFYLAQTCACLGDWQNACKWYKYRTNMNGWDEENFMALYRLAQAYENIDNPQKAVYYYLEAWAYRPIRAEPLIRLAEYYWKKGDKNLCFLFASQAVNLPYPQSDILFVEQNVYNFARYDLLGRSAWYVGEYDIGKFAIKKALQIKPNLDYLQKNLAYYTSRE